MPERRRRPPGPAPGPAFRPAVAPALVPALRPALVPALRLVLALALGLALSAASPARAAPAVEFLPMAEALERSGSEGKFTMLFFWTASCPVCRYFSDVVLADPGVAEDLGRGFLSVSIDSDRERRLARRYRVNSVPRLVFLDPAGEPATVLPGALEPPLFRLFLGYVASNSFRTMRFDEFVESLMEDPAEPAD